MSRRGEKPFIIKRNDTAPSLIVNITNKGCDGGWEPFNLSAVTEIHFSMADDCGNLIISSQLANTISDRGQIQYSWKPEDTAMEGNYMGEFELFFNNGDKMTIPRQGGIKIKVEEDINNL